jgi:hypothetical protein
VYRCKHCGETFDTPQRLGTHTYARHPESRRQRHNARTAVKSPGLEITVRMKASPTEMTRIEIPARTAAELEALYRAVNKYIAERPF